MQNWIVYIHVINVACYGKDVRLAGAEDDILQKMKRKEIPLEGHVM
jgi:hypothetical protein